MQCRLNLGFMDLGRRAVYHAQREQILSSVVGRLIGRGIYNYVLAQIRSQDWACHCHTVDEGRAKCNTGQAWTGSAGLPRAGYSVAAAFFAAQRFFSAATMAFRPSGLSFRFDFFAALAGAAAAPPLAAAQRRLCPSLIRSNASGLNLRFEVPRFVEGAEPAAAPDSIDRSSAICASIFCFCDSKPAIAASMISRVSVGIS
jgi:hypothetical protein